MTDNPYSTGLPGNLGAHSANTGLPVISIAGVEITTDSEGRFNLNALHKASKLGADKAPSQWLRNKQAKELIKELEKETMQICIVSEDGRNGGTFAHELLAVSYAGWISPSFQLKVNQAFLDMKSGARSSRPMTPAELFLQSAQMMYAIEQKQAAQDLALNVIDERVNIIEQLAPLKAKPHASETRSEIRKRMNQQYALSQPMVDAVLDNLPYSIGPFGMVKNSHEDAKGSSFPVYWIRDITKLFKRFVSECERNSTATYKHPSITRPFKMVKPEEK